MKKKLKDVDVNLTENDSEIRIVAHGEGDQTRQLEHVRHGPSELQKEQPPERHLDFGELVVAPFLECGLCLRCRQT